MLHFLYLYLNLQGLLFQTCYSQMLNTTVTESSITINSSTIHSFIPSITDFTKNTATAPNIASTLSRSFNRSTLTKIVPTSSNIAYNASVTFDSLSTIMTTLPLIPVENTTLVYYTVLKPNIAIWIQYSDIDQRKLKEILNGYSLTVKLIDLKNKFIFYGHPITTIGITTSGFLFTNEFLHDELTYSHYIAPLMAFFDTHDNPISKIKYFLNDTILVVWYEQIKLNQIRDKLFTFQVILYQSGDIIFNYRNIPIKYEDIPIGQHKVTAGLSDAYAIDADDPNYIWIHEYNRVLIPSSYIISNSSVILKIVETCLVQTTCTKCFEAKKRIPFNCQWCPVLSRCSDGLDRKRQEWLHYACPTKRTTDISNCDIMGTTDISNIGTMVKKSSKNYLFLLLLLFIIPVIGLLVWVLYAIKYPMSASGQFWIKNQPSKWCARLRDCCMNLESKPTSYVSFDQPHSNA